MGSCLGQIDVMSEAEAAAPRVVPSPRNSRLRVCHLFVQRRTEITGRADLPLPPSHGPR